MNRPARTGLLLLGLLFAALLPGALLQGGPPARAAETASATVEQLNAALLEVMQQADELGFQGRYDRLAPVLRQTFDFPAMARVVLGGHWSSISEAQQEAFTKAFADYSIGVFADRFDGFSGESFAVLGEEPARRGTVLVRNQIVKSDGEAIAINYLAKPEDDGTDWRIIDTILGGTASELAARRTEYTNIAEKSGIVALIDSLKDKTAAFAEE